jgi:hypothetical protein
MPSSSSGLGSWERIGHDRLLLAAMACCALLIGYQLMVTLLQPAWIGPATYWLRLALAWPTLLLAVYVSWRLSRFTWS